MSKETRCVSPQETVSAAARVMRDADVGFLPVCGRNGIVIGALTDRDIAIRAVAEGTVGDELTVEDIMTAEVVSCDPDDDIRMAEQRMKDARKSRIVCIDQDGALKGVISLADIARVEDEAHVAGTVRDVKQPAAGESLHS